MTPDDAEYPDYDAGASDIVPINVGVAQETVIGQPCVITGGFVINNTAAAITLSLFDGSGKQFDQRNAAATSRLAFAYPDRGIRIRSALILQASAAGPLIGALYVRSYDELN